MPPHPPTSPLFPYTTLFRSTPPGRGTKPDQRKRALRGLREAARAASCSGPGRVRSFGPSCHGSGGHAEKRRDRKSTRLNSSHVKISYAVFCLKKKKRIHNNV